MNVFYLPETAGLNLQHVVFVANSRDLVRLLKDGSSGGAFNDVYMGITRTEDILYIDQDVLSHSDNAVVSNIVGALSQKYSVRGALEKLDVAEL